MPKNIVICCDGTNNEIKANLSNVLKLFQVLRKNDDQVAYYDPGIGTLDSSNAWSRLRNSANQLFGLATGFGLDKNILDAYRFLMNNYQEGDNVFLFGFSRGAYTVRALAGFLRLVGLLERPQENLVDYALVAFKQVAETGDFEIAWRFQHISRAREIPIKFIGVWDTVSSVIAPGLRSLFIPKLIQLPYTRTNSMVQVFRHAQAIDERRRMFRLNRWNTPQNFKPNQFDPAEPVPQDIKQVWFCGDHSDVGGGYPENESGLAKFPLHWMIEEARGFGLHINTSVLNQIVLGLDRQGSNRKFVGPNSCAPIHISLTAAWKIFEFLPKSTRLKECAHRRSLFGMYLPQGEPRLISPRDRVHYSVFERMDKVPTYRPSNLPAKSELLVEGT